MSTEIVNSILTVQAGLKRRGKCCYTLPEHVVHKVGTMEIYRVIDSIEPKSSHASKEVRFRASTSLKTRLILIIYIFDPIVDEKRLFCPMLLFFYFALFRRNKKVANLISVVVCSKRVVNRF